MQLTQHTDFGLRLLIVLTRGEAVSLPAFAADQGLSYNHVAKVAQTLVHHGFATSRRGRGGGLSLARPAEEIAVGAVVRALESGLRLVDCARCGLRGGCALSGMLAEALDAFMAVLDRYSLADAARLGVSAFPAWALAPQAPGTCTLPGD